MTEPAYGVEHQLALRSEPQAAITQQIGKLGHAPMIMPVVPVLAVLGRGLLPADSSFIRADDLGLTRGDGIFETMHVRRGLPWLLDEHLRRFYESAALLDLEAPNPVALTDLAAQACAEWPTDQEGALKLVCTRGPEAIGAVTCYMTLNLVPEASIAARSAGLSLVGLPLGLAAHARAEAPWLLGGAKTLSYAINMASQRYAVAQGFDDALWISSDGYLLEAPTSTLVWRQGDRLLTVPTKGTGILSGTTARHALDRAGELGLTAGEEMITPAALASIDGAWLLSSVRGVAPIRELDAVALPTDSTTPLRALLGF
jgi:4-amino-4-deoxychorismate lyase